MGATLEGIEALLKSYNPLADVTGLEEAYSFAVEKHAGQMRKSGEPFVSHPVEVAMILAGLNLDTTTLQAALLHDVVEDSGVSLKEVRERFGPEVAALVDGVTKLGRIKVTSLAEAQSQNLRKMLIAMAKDIRVILIKLADRLHNMRTLAALPAEKRREKAIETMEIYAPLAHRLGISQIKWELEDLAFYYLEPKKFHQIQRMVAESRQARETYLQQVIQQLTDELLAIGITSEIAGRPKHLYSIYQKMSHKGKDFNEIYDLIALRVIVSSVKDVYGALGTVHSIWLPVPGRFKDYVAMPKFNMYQSLHTTVIGPAGRPLEIQIRTEEMHRTAEYGIAAHWRYKEGGRTDEAFDERLAWLRQMLEWQTELKDPREFMEALKIDLFEDEVFVFSPKGDVISLRRGSTPIDFAYAIHTEVGNHCVGAKVNGSIVPLTYELQMGDRVEVLTSKNASPSRDWLGIVKTSSARSKIRAHFSKVTRRDDVQAGRDEVLKALRKQGMGLGSQGVSKALEAVAKEANLQSGDDLLAAVGGGKQSAKQVVTKLIGHLAVDQRPAQKAEEEAVRGLLPSEPMIAPRSKRQKPGGGVKVVGIDDLLVRLAHCCNPVPGDDIVGFVTRGRGVSVHRADCPNAVELVSISPERILQVEWDTGTSTTYQVEILIEALDRTRMLQDVSIALADAGVNVLSAAISTDRQGVATMRFLLELGSMEQLTRVLATVRGIDNVFEARRALPEGSRPKEPRS
ncbi:MAG TPA: bifunctional (p)ppGpp synthetase/guanosine-3',5'-bis(diphosphate) 3'-pyrophosphohydrolase [Coriobacteriia bacterium]|nr:bifunctional (p)ppGpp synthetase/guanosine-3',5'-bis(diphosphate) 3'-pyrophosphohydrolase [Coriobacteriia bacterium]